jgi:hypothetical protein
MPDNMLAVHWVIVVKPVGLAEAPGPDAAREATLFAGSVWL